MGASFAGAVGATTSATAAYAADAASLIPAAGAHFGAYVYENGVVGPEPLEAKIGRTLAINHCFQLTDHPFPLQRFQQDIAAGRIPMLSWAAGEQPELAKILTGVYDEKIVTQAQQMKSLGVPMFLRFTWEFDMRYKDTGLFKDVWRYVHWKFISVNASNVAFVFCPTWRAYRETYTADEYYPGDSHVDWIAADGYARPHETAKYHYRPFKLMFDSAHTFSLRYGKPLMVGETGVHRDPANPVQAAWLNATRGDIKRYFPNLKAFNYFHRDGNEGTNNWRVTVPNGGPAQVAFTNFANDPYFKPSS